MYAVI